VPQGQSGRVQKISSPPGFDPRTVQPVAIHYNNCATQTTKISCMHIKIRLENLEERDHFEELVIGQRIILKKCILKKQVMIGVHTLSIWHTVGISGGFL